MVSVLKMKEMGITCFYRPASFIGVKINDQFCEQHISVVTRVEISLPVIEKKGKSYLISCMTESSEYFCNTSICMY